MSAQYELNFNMRGSGFKVNETAGESLGEHKLVYRGVDGFWWLADADAATTMPVLGITMGAIGGGRKGEILKWGYIGDNVWTWVAPGEIYASTTAGELTQTAPTGVGDIVQVVAKAVTDVIIEFSGNVNGSSSVYGDKITEASYIIFTQDVGGTPYYYAKNGTSGRIDFSGTDATTVTQAAIDSVHTGEGRGTIVFKGEFTPLATINTYENICLDLGESVFNWNVGDYLFKAEGSMDALTSLLTVNASQKDNVLTLVSVAGFSVGDYVLVYGDTIALGRSSKNGEIHKILSINVPALTLTLDGPLQDGYTVAQNAAAQKVNMIENPQIINGFIQGPSATVGAIDGVYFHFCVNPLAYNIKFDKIPQRAIILNSVIGGKAENNNIYGTALAGYGYGVAVDDYARGVTITHNLIKYCRHAIKHGTTVTGYGYPNHELIESNQIEYTTGSAIDSHSGTFVDSEINDNIIMVQTDNGGISLGGPRVKISGNHLFGVLSGTASGITDNSEFVDDLILTDNYLDNFYIAVRLGSDIFTTLKIDGLYCGDMNYGAILLSTKATMNVDINRVYLKSTTTYIAISITGNPESVTITNCRIIGALRSLISIVGATYGIIEENVLANAGMGLVSGNINRAAIYLTDCTNMEVTDNQFFDNQTPVTMWKAVCEAGTSNYNRVYENIIRNLAGTVPAIVVLGANTQPWRNIGYVTENSGTATIPNTATSIVVNHGCAYTPSALHVSLTLTNNPTTDPGNLYVDTFTATQMTIRCRNDPGATGAIIAWRVQRIP